MCVRACVHVCVCVCVNNNAQVHIHKRALYMYMYNTGISILMTRSLKKQVSRNIIVTRYTCIHIASNLENKVCETHTKFRCG